MARPRKAQELDIGRRAVEETIRLVAQRGDFDVPLTEVARAIGCTAPACVSACNFDPVGGVIGVQI